MEAEYTSFEEGSIRIPDAGRRNGFLFLFRLRTVRTSKFSASRLWQRTDRCLMPWRFWHALCSGTGRHLLGLLCFLQRKAVCPKSWIPGRKLRSSNCSPESQKKETVSPPGCYWLRLCICLAAVSGCVKQPGIFGRLFLRAVRLTKPAPGSGRIKSWRYCACISIRANARGSVPGSLSALRFLFPAGLHWRTLLCLSQPDREAVPSDVTPEKSWKFLVFCLIHRIWGSPPCAIKNLEAPKGACPCHCITHARNARASGTGPSAATAWKQNT